MKIRNIIQDDIVEDINIYKSIQKEFINFVKEFKPDYQPSFSFNEFCAKMIDNFEGVDEDINIFGGNGQPLVKKLFDSLMRIAIEELSEKEDIEHVENLIKNAK